MGALLLLVLIVYLLPAIGLCLLFRKAGEQGWKAFIPIYRAFVMLSISHRPWYWVLLQFIPFVGVFFSVAISIEFIKTFGKHRFYQYVLIPLTAGTYFLYLGLCHDPFKGPDTSGRPPIAGWAEIGAGLIAFLIVILLRPFFYDIYRVPTMSMEKTVRRGDILLVTKLAYGPRVPFFPDHRLFSRPVQRGDIMVFNFPEGDTVIALPDYESMRPYYEVIRELGAGNADSGRQIVLGNPDQYPLVYRPVYKRENYIKRCIAIPGDTLDVRNQVIYIDGQPQPFSPETETYCRVTTKGQPLDQDAMKEQWGVDINDPDEFQPIGSANEYRMLLTWTNREKMLKEGVALRIAPEIDSTTGEIFPNDKLHPWTTDNYGPLWIPQKGASIQLTPLNYPVYERIIRTYENNKLQQHNGKIYINDREQTTYTFKMNYYWVIGDNLHGSQDSRYWGFVPEDHVIGKTWLIWH